VFLRWSLGKIIVTTAIELPTKKTKERQKTETTALASSRYKRSMSV
jgi:hypothetical protein